MSDPHTPMRFTRMSTWSGATSGSGTSRSSIRPGAVMMACFIVVSSLFWGRSGQRYQHAWPPSTGRDLKAEWRARCYSSRGERRLFERLPTEKIMKTRIAQVGGVLVLAVAASFAGPALGQAPNLEKLKQMKVSGTDLNIPPVPQTGANADAIRENLKLVKLPPGFKIALYAVVPDARHMAVAPSTNMLFVGTRKTSVWAVTDRNSDGVADEVKSFAPSLKFSVPNGVCWTKDGFLIVAEHNRVLNFPAAEFFYEGPDVAVIEVVPQGKLIPVDEESYNHGARVCRVGKDGMLYIALGQPHNVPPRDKLALYNQVGIGGIVRMNAFDGSKREVYARGIRNSVGMDFNPKDGTLWFTDNQTDGMGDDTPPGELNRITAAGQNFGYPWLGGKSVRITDQGYDKD